MLLVCHPAAGSEDAVMYSRPANVRNPDTVPHGLTKGPALSLSLSLSLPLALSLSLSLSVSLSQAKMRHFPEKPCIRRVSEVEPSGAGAQRSAP